MKKSKDFRREPLTDTQLLMTITICIFVGMYLLAMLIFKGGFLHAQQVFDMLNDNASLIIVSCGLTVVMIGRGIDISVGAVTSFVVMSCVLYLNRGGSLFVSVLIALGIGLAFGIVQGFLISYLEIQPFIVTMAGLFFGRGMTAVICTDQISITQDMNKMFYSWANAKITLPAFLGYTNKKGRVIAPFIRPTVLIALAVVVVIFLVLKYTKFGRALYAVGGNPTSAAMMGLNVKKIKMRAYMLSSFLCSIGAICYCLNTMSGSVQQARGFEMDAIASSVIGGTLLTGGVGNVIGSLFGCLINGTITQLVTTNGKLLSSWANIATAALLMAFIILQSIFAMIKNRNR